jgi:CheY-like chemotaxis protein
MAMPSTERDETLRIRLTSLRHDLRDQIGLVVECAGLLLDDPAPNTSAPFVTDMTRILAAARRLLGLVDEAFGPEALESGPIDAETLGSQLRHELRTPLNHVIGYAEMLLEDAEEEGQGRRADDLRRIRSAGRQLTGMLEAALGLLAGDRAPVGEPGAPASVGGLETLEDLATPDRREMSPIEGRILIVDDDEVNRDVLSRRVRSQGAETEAVASGQEALDALRARPFDAVLLDVMMPDMNGYQVLREMKADTSLRDIPVVMISALNEVESTVRCIQLGAEDYLTKPFVPTLLRARLGACIEKKRLRDREIVHLRTIDHERRRADELLRAVFPPEIARELRATQKVRARRYENVAVLFSDTVGFTRFSDLREPEEIIDRLQRLVEGQEELAELHGLEKIKTIGDAFMGAAGLLRPMSDPVLACIRCGLDMIAAARELDPPWELRIGIHLGPLVGGVLGHRQYLFDLIGDTVNTASRIESAGVPGAVCLSGAAWQQVDHLSVGRSLGRVEIKGKGEIEIVRFERFR